jgi:hypothetical protein
MGQKPDFARSSSLSRVGTVLVMDLAILRRNKMVGMTGKYED